MKAMLFVKSNRLLVIVASFFLFSSPLFALSENDSVTTTAQLAEIKKKLDASQKREEQILANQEKILSEIVISRKWARRG